MPAAQGKVRVEKGLDGSDILPVVMEQVRSNLAFLDGRLQNAGAKVGGGTFGKSVREGLWLYYSPFIVHS